METLLEDVVRHYATYEEGSEDILKPRVSKDTYRFISMNPHLGYSIGDNINAAILMTNESMLPDNKQYILENVWRQYNLDDMDDRVQLYKACVDRQRSLGIAYKILVMEPPIPLRGDLLDTTVTFASCAMLDYLLKHAERHSIEDADGIVERMREIREVVADVRQRFFTDNPVTIAARLIDFFEYMHTERVDCDVLDVLYYAMMYGMDGARVTRQFVLRCAMSLWQSNATCSTDTYTVQELYNYALFGRGPFRADELIPMFYLSIKNSNNMAFRLQNVPALREPLTYLVSYTIAHRTPQNEKDAMDVFQYFYGTYIRKISHNGNALDDLSNYVNILWTIYRRNPEGSYSLFSQHNAENPSAGNYNEWPLSSNPSRWRQIDIAKWHPQSAHLIRIAMFLHVLNIKMDIPDEITDFSMLEDMSPSKLEDIYIASRFCDTLIMYAKISNILSLCARAMKKDGTFRSNLQRFREMCFYEFAVVKIRDTLRLRKWYNMWLPLAPQFLLCAAAECVLHADNVAIRKRYVNGFRNVLEAITTPKDEERAADGEEEFIDESLLYAVVRDLLADDCHAALYQAMRIADLGFANYPRTFSYLHQYFSAEFPVQQYLEYVENDLDVEVGRDDKGKAIKHPMHTRFASDEQRKAFTAHLHKVLEEEQKELAAKAKRTHDSSSPQQAKKRIKPMPTKCAFHDHASS